MFDLVCEIRELVRDAKARSKSGRCRFTEDQKMRIMLFTEEVVDRGLQVHDAAEILGMHKSTLQRWMDWAWGVTERQVRLNNVVVLRQ